jgi:hypothetical protein
MPAATGTAAAAAAAAAAADVPKWTSTLAQLLHRHAMGSTPRRFAEEWLALAPRSRMQLRRHSPLLSLPLAAAAAAARGAGNPHLPGGSARPTWERGENLADIAGSAPRAPCYRTVAIGSFGMSIDVRMPFESPTRVPGGGGRALCIICRVAIEQPAAASDRVADAADPAVATLAAGPVAHLVRDAAAAAALPSSVDAHLCSDVCRAELDRRTGRSLRRAAFEVDRGICALCHTDTRARELELLGLPRTEWMPRLVEWGFSLDDARVPCDKNFTFFLGGGGFFRYLRNTHSFKNKCQNRPLLRGREAGSAARCGRPTTLSP